MIIISHRGNLDGVDKNKENLPTQVLKCIEEGFDVEIDVWKIDNVYFLGHDEPQYQIDFEFLKNKKLWCHAKNLNALRDMLRDRKINCFWHQKDDYTLTSKNNIWTYPNKELTSGCIAVLTENTDYSFEDLKKCYGICTDNPKYYEKILHRIGIKTYE